MTPMTMTPMTPAIYLSLLCRIYLYYYIYNNSSANYLTSAKINHPTVIGVIVIARAKIFSLPREIFLSSLVAKSPCNADDNSVSNR
jgi:hypothetical protein